MQYWIVHLLHRIHANELHLHLLYAKDLIVPYKRNSINLQGVIFAYVLLHSNWREGKQKQRIVLSIESENRRNRLSKKREKEQKGLTN